MKVFKSVALFVQAAALAVASWGAMAQGNYPDKPIRMIIPLATGSAVDNALRLVAQNMATSMGQPIVIENVTGSSGLIGADRMLKMPADGYTIGGVNDSVLTMVPHINPNTTFNTLKDFAPVSLIGTIEWGVVVKVDSQFKTLEDLVKFAKANPDKLTFGSGGVGSPQHLAMALLMQRADVKLVHVPYKGATQAAVGAAAGEVDVSFQGLGTVAALINGGKLRLLALSTPKPLDQFAGVPTIDQSIFPDFFFNSWAAIVASAKTPKAIVEKLSAEARKAMDNADIRDRFTKLGITIRGTTPAEFEAALKKQYELYGKVIKDNNIKAE
jgi:tripartite-type tricarboxylate transporter receptor subunit TctC